MEDKSEKETLPNLQTILNAINDFKKETNRRFDGIEVRLSNLEKDVSEIKTRLSILEKDIEKIKEMQFVFENEFDRLLALSYKSLELSHENRADVRIMRKEIEAWSKDIKDLERKVM